VAYLKSHEHRAQLARITMIRLTSLLSAAKYQQWVDMGEPAEERCQPTPTEGRSCVSTEQRENLEAFLRQAAFPGGSDVTDQRRRLRELTAAGGVERGDEGGSRG
jgi:hypothetical protein